MEETESLDKHYLELYTENIPDEIIRDSFFRFVAVASQDGRHRALDTTIPERRARCIGNE
jgi:hypothetical protein